MNAYEIAEELEYNYSKRRSNKIMTEAAVMLRIQQAHIESLEKHLTESLTLGLTKAVLEMMKRKK